MKKVLIVDIFVVRSSVFGRRLYFENVCFSFIKKIFFCMIHLKIQHVKIILNLNQKLPSFLSPISMILFTNIHSNFR
mgnify:CR=1 FL=1